MRDNKAMNCHAFFEYGAKLTIFGFENAKKLKYVVQDDFHNENTTPFRLKT